jgi:hypothetical protein
MSGLLNSLTERELGLVREAAGERLGDLDEDALLELHTRVRRARDRQVKIYRRQAASLVPEVGGRGKAHPRNTRNRAKAEVFEDALARVSRHLAAAARKSAAALKAERLAEARRDARAPSGRARAPRSSPLEPQLDDRRPDGPGVQKRYAATRAEGARRQARRDSR